MRPNDNLGLEAGVSFTFCFYLQNITRVHSSMLGPRDAKHAELDSLNVDLDPLDVSNEYSNTIRAAMCSSSTQYC